MLIYIITFIICVLIDRLKGSSYKLIKTIFLVYLYFFFCFGYTTGTDWKYYELLYNTGSDAALLDQDYEWGFYYLVFFIRKILPDFWLFLGIVKCIYLFSVIKVIRLFTPNIFLVLGLLMNFNLLFMLIDNPLRFMMGSTILLLATPFFLKKKFLKFLIISSISLIFHISLIIPIAIILFYIYFKYKISFSSRKIVIIYIISTIISFLPTFLTFFSEVLASTLPFIARKLLEAYLVTGVDINFTIGSFILLLFFILILKYKNTILESQHGHLVLFGSLVYLNVARALINFPAGFRISIYFSVFFVVALVLLIRKFSIEIKVVLVLIMGFTMSYQVWNNFQFLPYTNSISYILSGKHLSYSYRTQLNINEYQKRTGKIVENPFIEVE